MFVTEGQNSVASADRVTKNWAFSGATGPAFVNVDKFGFTGNGEGTVSVSADGRGGDGGGGGDFDGEYY